MEILLDPLFRVPFVTGLAYALVLPALGLYLRLNNEWLAALAFSQLGSTGALLGMAAGLPPAVGGMGAALAGAGVKGIAGRRGDTVFVILLLLAWSINVLTVANHPGSEKEAHALFDGQLYFAGTTQWLLSLLAAAIAAGGIGFASRVLLTERLFPEFHRARGIDPRPRQMAFDAAVALALALATTAMGVMAAFALVFGPALTAARWVSGWKPALLASVLLGLATYVTAFAAALLLDQPFGPACALATLGVSGLAELGARVIRRR